MPYRLFLFPKRACLFLVFTALVLGGLTTDVRAEERILSFHSDIVINQDSSLKVTETIRVSSEGQNIRRGIFRDFPTTYRDENGRRVRVGFDVIEVKRDGAVENYAVESISNGKRVRIGSADIFLQDGIHEYAITYRTTRQLGFFEVSDELYWNVTGNGWQFAIDKASATVYLPNDAPVLTTEAYTGGQGESDGNFRVTRAIGGEARFETTRRLDPYQGLTIVVAWPKGYVEPPTATDETWYLLSDNAPFAVSGLGLIAMLIYYTRVWLVFGRDPARGTIIPRFSPPPGFSPAASRFVRQMGYDRTAFAAALINMAVKGYLKIDEGSKGFTLTRLIQDDKGLSKGERRIASALFGRSESIALEKKNHSRIMKAISGLKEGLEREFQAQYFATNATYFYIGVGVSIVIAIAMAIVSDAAAEIVFMMVWLSLWSVGTAMLGGQVVNRWRSVFSGPGSTSGKVMSAVGMSVFALPFFIGEAVALGFVGASVSFAAIACIVGIILVNAVFFYLLKAPTLAGARIHDELDGFKMYLETAERDRLEAMYPPKMTPQLFEKFLPFALALGVEQQWSEAFEASLPDMSQEDARYRPGWYSGSSWNRFGASNFANTLGSSIASAAVSSSTPPGSSSGSGGGGFSGGGGGGGGGGGW